MTTRRSIVLTGLMGCAALAASMGRPGATVRRDDPDFRLHDVVPVAFGDWQEVRESKVSLVNPQTQQLLDKLYSQLLNRTYANGEGYRVMLSLAYGDDQRGGLRAHMPEVCYPAQGFAVHAQAQREIDTAFGRIPAQRLQTSLSARREPVTYWFTLGNSAVGNSRFAQRLVEIRFGLSGQVPDGLLFRVSSIDPRPEHAFRMHDQFVRDLLGSLSDHARHRLSGLSS